MPIWESSGAVPPFGGIPAGNANSFIVPDKMKGYAATIRRMLRK